MRGNLTLVGPTEMNYRSQSQRQLALGGSSASAAVQGLLGHSSFEKSNPYPIPEAFPYEQASPLLHT